MSLVLEEIIKVCKSPPKMERVETPGWTHGTEGDAYVFVRALPATSATLVAEMCQRSKDDEKLSHENMYVEWCILCCCDENGKLLFDESHKEALLAGPYAPVQECGSKALDLNGVSADKTGKNSESRDDSSRSGSPKNAEPGT